jgi:hypothetical protein
MHAEAFERFGGSPKPNRPTLLLNRKGSEEYRNEAILAERTPELAMAGDLV